MLSRGDRLLVYLLRFLVYTLSWSMIFYRQYLEIDILHALCTDPGAIGAWVPAGEIAFDLETE